jgi:hypothetical protein
LDVGERVREAGETLKKISSPPPPTTLTIPPLVGERGREVGIGREAERDTIEGWKGSAKGLGKRVLWVGSMGKGSLLRDWKGL